LSSSIGPGPTAPVEISTLAGGANDRRGGSDSGEHAQQRETIEQLYKAINQLPKADAALVLLHLDELKRCRRPRRIELPHDEQIEISFPCFVFVFVLPVSLR
jgi:hypothetical protein